MKTQLALRNLAHHRARTVVAIAGVAFAVVLIFMQLGFLGAVAKTATMIYDAIDFDLAIRSPAYLHLSEPRTFPRIRIDQAASLSAVKSALPFYIQINDWQSPTTGEWRGIMTIGANPHRPVFRVPEIREQVKRLTQPQFVLMDRKSRPDFGPANEQRFSDHDIGVETDLARRRVQIVGHFELGTGLAANGAAILSEEGFARVSQAQTINDVNVGMIRLAEGSNAEAVKAQLQSQFAAQADVDVLTRNEVLAYEHKRWVSDTSLGTIFQLGLVVSLFVGFVIVYQVLSTDIANMMHEYATLKAMGYSDRRLAGVIVQQAVVLAALGFVPGTLIAWCLYAVTGAAAAIPMSMTAGRTIGVFALTVAMCTCSGLAALRKLRTAEPAELF